MKQRLEAWRTRPIPSASSIGLATAIVNAKPRKATPSAAPIISAEWSLSMGSKNVVRRASATLLRRLKLIPAVVRARTLRTKRRPLSYSA